MNHHYLLFPLIAAVAAAAPEQQAGTVEQFEQARLEYEALQALLHIKAALTDKNEELLPPVDRKLFLQGFREQLAAGEDFPFKRLFEHGQKRARHIEEQIKNADFLTPHANQPGVTTLPGGLQYATFTHPDPTLNYRARRAHCLQATVPGTRLHLPISGTPVAVDDALYEAPRGMAWQFLLPTDLLDEVDAAPLKKAGLHTVEILAVRESLNRELREQAQAYFAARTPQLPVISLETPELHAERSRLMGMLAAHVIDAPTEPLIARVEELLVRIDTPQEELEEELERATRNYWLAREELRRMQHRQIAAEIMQLQHQIPGTRVLSNGLLCRTSSGSPQDKPLPQARYIEEEELGPEMYLRVRDRIVYAPNDLPDAILRVLPEIPEGTAWELILPPSLRGEGHELPLLYRIRTTPPRPQQAAPVLPDTI
ncbi:MAG: FKBP-type peptidyl-prolyl cis-trans isomerase N-terminal domain-containing protein [Akkermansia sp.]|nr:FKBP-type peptidyl-prolyl cis-trans isomerase N-terminal domain-containing protein [Akkermansia sp.]